MGTKSVFESKIKNIYPAETSQNGVSSYKVVFDLAGQDSNLKSGMTGTAKIKISEQAGAIVVPQSSVFSDAGKKYVMVMSGGFPAKERRASWSVGFRRNSGNPFRACGRG